jgi:hypothetical protein
MITGDNFRALGFEWSDYTNGYVHPDDPNRTWISDEDGEIYIRESDNYHGLSFKRVWNYDDVRVLYRLLNGSDLLE